MFGVEHQNLLIGTLQNHDVPCAVCHISTREAVIMIPTKFSCPTNWMIEYTGYLMSESWDQSVSTFECVSDTVEAIPGLETKTDSGTFYHTEANCNGMPCPPNVAEKELTCAVCTC